MTILAGLWHPGRIPVPGDLAAAILGGLSRRASDARWVHERPGSLLAKVDIGAFGEPAAYVDADGAATIVSGEPLLERPAEGEWRPRTRDTQLLHEAFRRGDDGPACGARGQYCAALFDPALHRLVLCTDLLGIRALYHAQVGEWLMFATSLRQFESVPGLTLHLDAQGAFEQALLQAPLAGRTPFREVRLLGPAEVVECRPEQRSSRRLFHWDRVQPRERTEAEALDDVDRVFHAAIARRRQGDTATTAFLSGGLDSRVIVAGLLRAGLKVRTLNFSLVGSLDQALGGMFAQAAGTPQVSRPYSARLQDSYEEMAAAALADPRDDGIRPERPALLWSGYGGSGILGQINNKPEYVALLREGHTEAAVELLHELKGLRLPRRLLRRRFAEPLDVVLRDGVMREVERMEPADPGRRIDLYLLHNSARCQLHPQQESVDDVRLEQQVPMLDPTFVQLGHELPFEMLARHRLYHLWLERFGPPVTAVPWQAYPGHEPCPIPLPEGARPQWTIAAEPGFRRGALIRSARRLLAGNAPFDVLSWPHLALGSAAHFAGVRDFAYGIRLSSRIAAWWERCGRRPVPPVRSSAMEAV